MTQQFVVIRLGTGSRCPPKRMCNHRAAPVLKQAVSADNPA